MRTFEFNRNKHNKELLIDCLSIHEISALSTSLKEMHTTSFYELYFFTEAEGTISIENKIYQIDGACIVMLPPLVARQWDISFNKDSYVVFFEQEIFEYTLKDAFFLYRLQCFNFNSLHPILPVKDGQCSNYYFLIQKIMNEIANIKDDSIYLLNAYLYQLLLEINRNYVSYFQIKEALNTNSEVINFKTLLKKNIHSIQTVNGYADLMGITRNHLNKICIELLGRNASSIIKNELLLACKTELLASCITVAEISYKFNFSAPSNFTRFFKDVEGISPGDYRKKFQNDKN
ncbi:AraC family transcriptional regulator [Plebeiibacterium sediminum]|uniref:AraC family transcriptional regulator n=1 Tax=Plebeiibacterium sediminum TaxID=2992112 RepID=A0AAE3SH86_9BACT|nr:helix-turn-helix transcriptional regulator [Plebeiobacterium sediminum]MCW3788942.1 AraC family transcriptional regulator [Plebeiobacterium sediminum]